MPKKNHKHTPVSAGFSSYVYSLGPVGRSAFSRKAMNMRRRATAAILPQLLTACVVVSAVLVFGAYFWPTESLGQAVTEITNCQTISQSGSYVLARSFSYNASEQPTPGVCISIAASDVTLNGGGNTITAVGTVANGQFAVDMFDYYGSYSWNNVLVENLNSNAVVRTFGPTIHHITFDHLTVYGVKVIGSDDVTITNNTLASGAVSVDRGDNDDESWVPYRPVISNNIISGDASWMFEISGTSWNTTVCPNISAVVEGNSITNNYTGPAVDSYTVRIRCATHSTVTNNTVRVTGPSMGLYLRDESDDGTYTNNVFLTTGKKALHIGAGNDNKTHPARNVFRNNVFSTTGTYAVYVLGMGGGNQFIDNVFYSHSDLGTPNGDTILGIIGSDFGDTFDHNTFYADGTGAAMFSIADGGQAGPPRVTFTNNIFSYNSAQAVWQYDNFPRSRYIGDYNIFNNRGGGSVSFGNYGANLAAWSAGSPSSDTHSLVGDPLFTNVAAGDYSLLASSIGHNAASDGTDMGARSMVSVPACTENWSCGSWGVCANSQQTRTCVDANSCGTTTSRPALAQSCVMSCEESWQCGDWSTCSNGAQSRTCTDAHQCGTVVHRPPSQQSCTVSCTENWSCGDWSTCDAGAQTRTCADANRCGTALNQPPLSQSCAVNLGPSITITHPTGKRVAVGIFTASATVKDPNGVAEVRFLIDGRLFGRDTRAPYAVNLDTRPLRNGVHTISIQATDKLGAVSQASRMFSVKNPLLVRISIPNTRGIITGTVALRPRLIYGGTPVTLTEYWLDRRLLTTTTEEPFVVSWDSRTVKNGTHRFSIRVTDTTGKRAVHTVYLRVKN